MMCLTLFFLTAWPPQSRSLDGAAGWLDRIPVLILSAPKKMSIGICLIAKLAIGIRCSLLHLYVIDYTKAQQATVAILRVGKKRVPEGISLDHSRNRMGSAKALYLH
jgi:hypothetical protein